MSNFLEAYFNEYDFSGKETAVRCPFPHRTLNGIEYLESNPSAHVNIEKQLFHCKVCGEGKSTATFMTDILGMKYEKALKLKEIFERSPEEFLYERNNVYKDDNKKLLNSFGVTDSVIDKLKVKALGESIIYPITMYGVVVDERTYTPNGKPKVKSKAGAMSGLVFPFDLLETYDESKWTLICAGEKDMAVAMSHGFQAVTITGGEQALPVTINCFKNKKIAICYDNDPAGVLGANKLVTHLLQVAKEIKVVTDFHEVCIGKGEDITDYFTKYKKTRDDLINCIINTNIFTEVSAKELKENELPIISLKEASQPNKINAIVRSNIQVVATFDDTFVVPTVIEAKKYALGPSEKGNTMLLGDKELWDLNEGNAEDILELMDNNFTEEKIAQNIRKILRIPKSESCITVNKPSKETIYKCGVTDLFEANAKDIVAMEYTAYSIGKKLDSGKKYKVTYKLTPHPYKGQALIMIILDAEESSDSVSSFQLTDTVKANLKVFQDIPGTVEEKVETLTEKFKGVLGFNGYNKLIQVFDLAYHTVLEFDFGSFKNVRGYLDTLIVAESRVGKSSTAEAMQQLYNLGVFTSLAGSSATIAGLVGGSNKVGGSFQTKAGLIPQNHRGLIVFEELGKCSANILKELTDIKSSNQVRITRVSGNLNLPALVRMITLTNVKSGDTVRSIASYPNGIEVIMELVGTPEDVARFDMMYVLAAKGDTHVDPFWKPEEPLPIDCYRDRIRWVWSRTAEQVLITESVGRYLLTQCNELNKDYDCYIKIFGTEAWKKVSRLAIAVAGFLVSTDDSYEKIIVTEEHVDFAVKFLKELYDNGTFRLKEYVTQERQYNNIDDAGVALLQELYNRAPELTLQLGRSSTNSRNNLMSTTGMTNDSYNMVMKDFVKGMFVRYQGHEIVPTERFRLGYNRINKNTSVPKIGEKINEYTSDF